MNVLFILILIFIFLIGYLFMIHTNKFIQSGEIIDSLEGRRKKGILIFGSKDAVNAAVRENIEFTEITETNLQENDAYYSAILILSQNEQDNLELCKNAYLYDPDLYIIVKCNNSKLTDVFKKLGASYVLTPEESTKQILEELWRVLK